MIEKDFNQLSINYSESSMIEEVFDQYLTFDLGTERIIHSVRFNTVNPNSFKKDFVVQNIYSDKYLFEFI
jgi:hypothetical protein